MKKAILFLLIISAATAQGQSLKDLLYGGKLKKDSTGVIRKTDDLKAKIDTADKRSETQQAMLSAKTSTETTNIAATNPSAPAAAANTTATTNATTENANNNSNTINNQVVTTSTVESNAPTATPVKSNNKIWKEFSDALVADLKDVIAQRKVKKETYYVTVEYEIGVDGVTTINNVTMSPDNDFLLANVKQRISDTPPQLSGSLNSAGQPQKVKRRYNFLIVKD